MKRPWFRRGVLCRLRGRPGEEGVALVIVIGTMMTLAMVALVALSYAVAGQKFARYDQDYAAAMNAAQTGVDDFVSRLNRDSTYGVDVDCHNLAWQGPHVVGGGDCGWNNATPVGWLPVTPNDTDPNHAYFHYIVDRTNMKATGTVVLDVTGRINGVYRTIETAVGKGGSTDYVYYTDFEDADPNNVQAYPTYPTDPACGSDPLHWWEGRDRSSHDCVEITFASGDVLDGAVFTNDTILSDGATFKQQVETATTDDPDGPDCATAQLDNPSTWNAACLRSGSTAHFNGLMPVYQPPLKLEFDTSEFVTNPGCHYYGSTRVIFNGTKMTVWNQGTVNNHKAPVSIAPPGGSAPSCGTLDPTGSINGQVLDVPDGMVVYAQGSGAAASACRSGDIGGPAGGRILPLGSYTGAAATSGASYTIDTNMQDAVKQCGEGNLYAEGTLTGRVTIAAQQSVVVTGDLVVSNWNSTNMLGLVAQNSVEVMHPRMATYKAVKTCNSCSTYQWTLQNDSVGDAGTTVNAGGGTTYNYTSLGTWPTDIVTSANPGVEIDGSIQTLQHSFFVQKYDQGRNYGKIHVRGSIAQKWRGIVGRNVDASGNGTGYLKDYSYDERLTNDRPPYFPLWANSEWTARYTGEIQTPDGIKG